MNLKLALSALAFVGFATNASALSLNLIDNVNGFATVSFEDGDTEDESALENVIKYDQAFGGFQIQASLGIVSAFPPFDKLFADLDVALLDSAEFASGDVTLEVSHVFDGPDIDAAFNLTQDLNTLTGMGDVETFVGTTLFDKATSLSDIQSMLSSEKADVAGGGLNLDSYSITHVINLKSDCAQCTLQGSADITVEPVPVPAGILLMGTALAGFGVMRRRKKQAA